MSTTKTKRQEKSGKKVARQRTVKPVADAPKNERAQAYAYSTRVEPITAALKALGGSATVAELFKAVSKSAAGREQFGTPRRINATWRQSVRHMERPPFISENGTFRLAKRGDRASAPKPHADSEPVARVGKRNAASGKVSRKRTRSA